MCEYTIEIMDSLGLTMKIRVCLLDGTNATWQALDNGFFCHERGVANTGYYPTVPEGWLSLYGGDACDDSKLVFHLDGFRGHTFPSLEGKGWIYPQDYLLMQQGAITWRLLA